MRNARWCPLCGEPVDPDADDDGLWPFTPRASNPNVLTYWIHWEYSDEWSETFGPHYDDANWLESLRQNPNATCQTQRPAPQVALDSQVRVGHLRFYAETNRKD